MTAASTLDLPLDSRGMDWTRFQDFVRDLFERRDGVRRVRAMGTQGDAQQGIDLIVDLESGGVCGVQVRRVATFGPADLKHAAEATTFPADHYVVALSREATVGVREEEGRHPDWEVWDLKDLSACVRAMSPDDARDLLLPHFGREFTAAFLGHRPRSPFETVERFFDTWLDEDQLFHHAWPLVGRNNVLAALDAWLADQSKPVAVLSGRGASGKTKLLYEWARRVAERGDVEVRFLSDSAPLTDDSVLEHPLEPCVVIVDDAHNTTDIHRLLRRARERLPNLRILLSTRPHASEHLSWRAQQAGFAPDQVADLGDLAGLTSEERQELARAALGPRAEHLGPELAILTRDSPLMTVVGGQLLRKGSLPLGALRLDGSFRDAVLSRFTDALVGRVSETVDPGLARHVLGLVAVTGILRPESDEDVERAAKVLKVEPHDLRRDLSNLVAAGVLVRRGSYVRVTPDVLAERLARDACLTHEGRPTGFGEVVRTQFWDLHGARVLQTLALLDWEHGTPERPSGLLDDAWAALAAEAAAGDTRGRTRIMEALRRVAPYQPVRTLEFVRSQLPHLQALEPESREGVSMREGLVHLLTGIAHHLEHLPACVQILWELAKHDRRPPPQHPGHPLRGLEDIAEWGSRKPVAFQARVIQTVRRLAGDPGNLAGSPSIVALLRPVLSKVGREDSYDGVAVHFRSFLVDPERASPLLREVLSILDDVFASGPLAAKSEVIDAWAEMVRPPMPPAGGEIPEDIEARWEPIRLEALSRLASVAIGVDGEALRLKAIDDLHWYAGHDAESAVGQRAREALETVNGNLKLRVAHALCTPHLRKGPVDLEAEHRHVSLEEGARTCRDVANAFLKAHPGPAEQAAIVAGIVADAEMASLRPAPYSFVHALLEASPETAEELCHAIRRRPELGTLVGTLPQCLVALRRIDAEKAARVAGELAGDGRAGLQGAVLETYSRLPQGTKLLDQESKLLDLLAASGDEHARLGVFRARVTLASGDREALLRCARDFDIGSSPSLAEGFLGALFYPGPLDASNLSSAERDLFLEKLVAVERLHAWEITHFLGKVAEQAPVEAARFLLARVKAPVSRDYRYDPIPFEELDEAFAHLRDSPEWPGVLREVRDCALDPDARDVVSAFALLSLGYASESVPVLEEWLLPGASTDQIAAIVSLLKEAGTDFFFKHQGFLRRLVAAIEGLGGDAQSVLLARLARHACPNGGVKAVGVPDPKEVECMERAEAAAAACDPGDPLRAYYRRVAAEARRSIDFDRRLDEAHLDAYGS